MGVVPGFNRRAVMYEKPMLQRYGTFREVTQWYTPTAGTNDIPGGNDEPGGSSQIEDDRAS